MLCVLLSSYIAPIDRSSPFFVPFCRYFKLTPWINHFASDKSIPKIRKEKYRRRYKTKN